MSTIIFQVLFGGDISSYLVGSQSSLVLNQVGAPAQTK